MATINSENTVGASKNNGMPSTITTIAIVTPLPLALPYVKPFLDISKIEVFEGQNFK